MKEIIAMTIIYITIAIILSLILHTVYVIGIKPIIRKKKLLKSFRESLEINQLVSFNLTNDYGTKIVKTGFINEIEQGYCEIISKNHECSVVKYIVLTKHIYPTKWFEKDYD